MNKEDFKHKKVDVRNWTKEQKLYWRDTMLELGFKWGFDWYDCDEFFKADYCFSCENTIVWGAGKYKTFSSCLYPEITYEDLLKAKGWSL